MTALSEISRILIFDCSLSHDTSKKTHIRKKSGKDICGGIETASLPNMEKVRDRVWKMFTGCGPSIFITLEGGRFSF